MADERIGVDVVENPSFLASPKIHDYKAIIFHWKDQQKPAPGPEAQANFKRFVANGGGVVFVHFACGAWQKWPEFVNIAGRVWNPKLRGHDPHGKFRVDIIDQDHPITKGMKPFETVDELYTCLDGNVPIHVIANAKSKVDQKLYPMAFVLTHGKGRIFHCVLGHSTLAFEAEGVQELFRRGTAWVAGIPVESEGE
jgi:type 1 glutamine amidotransferase